MKRKIVLFAIMVSLIIASLASTAYAATIFPLNGQKSSYFPYTKEDEVRYKAIYDRAFFATPEADRKEYEKDVQHNIDFFASLSMEERNSFPGIYAMPDENAIQKEIAIYTAYAAMESLFNYSEDILVRYYPVCFYDIKNPENPIWYISFRPIGLENLQRLYTLGVYMQASDGLIIKIVDSSDAVG